MWEVRIGSELIEEFSDNAEAQLAARKLREQGKEARVIPTGSFVPTGAVEIDVLPASLRKTR